MRRRRSLAYPKPCSIEWWDTRSTYCNPVNLQNTTGGGFVFLLQVASLLWEFLWLSVGQDSHLPIQPVLHVIHIHDSSIPLRRLDTYTPSALLRLTGFMGSPSIADTDLDYWGPTLIADSDLPSWVRSRVWRWCRTNLIVVSWDIHLCHFDTVYVFSRVWVYYESIKRNLKIRCMWVSVWWKTTN